MTDLLYVCFTMDCERIAAESPTGGPESWELAEHSAHAFAECLLSYDYKPTFFVVPETARKQAKLFQELQSAGAECGVHFHDHAQGENWRRPEGVEFLGAYPAEIQRSKLAAARSEVADALGAAPLAFRPGNFSANDSTFPVLVALGFTHGSVSLPGRCEPQLRAVWTGTEASVHRAHAYFRLIAGELDFVDVPVTVDLTRRDHWAGVGDLRFETTSLPELMAGVRDALSRQAAARARLHHLCFFTHNVFGYWEGASDPATITGRMTGLLRALPELAGEHGLRPVAATVAEVRQAYLAPEA